MPPTFTRAPLNATEPPVVLLTACTNVAPEYAKRFCNATSTSHRLKELLLTSTYILCILRLFASTKDLVTAAIGWIAQRGRAGNAVLDRCLLRRSVFCIVTASICLAIERNSAGSATSEALPDAFVDVPCPLTNLSHARYIYAETRDTLEQYAAKLRKYGKPVTLTADNRSYGKIYVVATPHGWALWEELRADNTSYTLRPTDSALMRYVITTTRMFMGYAPPRTKRGFALGDPIAKVVRAYGNGAPTTICGLSERAFAGRGRFGDWYAIYGADARGKIAFVKTGDVSSGIRHLWQQPR